MALRHAFIVPHPPLIIPEVGRGKEKEIPDVVQAMEEVGDRICAADPETLFISAPHAQGYRNTFALLALPRMQGNMGQFAAWDVAVDVLGDDELADEIAIEAHKAGVAVMMRERGTIDYACLIPIYFAQRAYARAGKDFSHVKVVITGLSGLDEEKHREYGRCIARAVWKLERDCVYVASGDLSHKLLADGPYGFAKEGPVLDEQVCDILRSGDIDGFFRMDRAFRDAAAECGIGSFQIMTGALEQSLIDCGEGVHLESELLAHQGPFGVGYGVGALSIVDGEGAAASSSAEAHADTDDGADPYAALARQAVEYYVRNKKPLPRPESLSEGLIERAAGVFVSIHKLGALRGCIGTIQATTGSIADEIIQNAVSASSRDPRFPAIQPSELDDLEISVDVLSEAEDIDSIDQLDPKRYGVIVTKGWSRGLLLPDLEGVDTAEDQVAIAKRKAGIPVNDNDVELQRFEVVRHE